MNIRVFTFTYAHTRAHTRMRTYAYNESRPVRALGSAPNSRSFETVCVLFVFNKTFLSCVCVYVCALIKTHSRAVFPPVNRLRGRKRMRRSLFVFNKTFYCVCVCVYKTHTHTHTHTRARSLSLSAHIHLHVCVCLCEGVNNVDLAKHARVVYVI